MEAWDGKKEKNSWFLSFFCQQHIAHLHTSHRTEARQQRLILLITRRTTQDLGKIRKAVKRMQPGNLLLQSPGSLLPLSPFPVSPGNGFAQSYTAIWKPRWDTNPIPT